MASRSPALRRKELLAELHYQQQRNRIDVRVLRAGRARCKELGKQLRELSLVRQVELQKKQEERGMYE